MSLLVARRLIFYSPFPTFRCVLNLFEVQGGVGVLVWTMPEVIEGKANMMSATEAPVKIDMALTGKGGPLESHLVVKKTSTVETMEEREIDMTGLSEHLVCLVLYFTVSCP